MKTVYSIYEAKARLSEIIRQVKRNRRVTITERGRDVARVVPISKTTGFEARIRELEARGVVTRASGSVADIRPVARIPGAVRRFLASRD